MHLLLKVRLDLRHPPGRNGVAACNFLLFPSPDWCVDGMVCVRIVVCCSLDSLRLGKGTATIGRLGIVVAHVQGSRGHLIYLLAVLFLAAAGVTPSLPAVGAVREILAGTPLLQDLLGPTLTRRRRSIS